MSWYVFLFSSFCLLGFSLRCLLIRLSCSTHFCTYGVIDLCEFVITATFVLYTKLVHCVFHFLLIAIDLFVYMFLL